MDKEKQEQARNYVESQDVKELAQSRPDDDRSGSETLQETDEVKRELRKILRGKQEEDIWDDEMGEWRTVLKDKDGVQALINKQGLEDLWAIVEPIVSETAAGSNLSARDVGQEGYQALQSVIGSILVKHDEYNIDDPEDATLIVQAFHAAVKNNLKKAEGGRLLKHYEESTLRRVLNVAGADDSSGGSRWNPFS